MRPYLLHQLLADSAKRHPDRIAIAFRDGTMSYAGLDHGSNRVASALMGMGVKPGDRVGILLPKSAQSLVVIFGILKSGAAYVPIDFLAPRNRVEYILNRCGIRFLFANREGADRILPSDGSSSCLRTIILTGEDGEDPADRPGGVRMLAEDEFFRHGKGHPKPTDLSDTNPAYILHTSGSTGMPKGVGLSHRNSMTFVDMAAEYFGIEKEDRLGCHAPLQFDLTVFDIFVAIRNGAAIVLVPDNLSVFPTRLAQFLDESRITVWNSVASVLSLLAERGRMERFRFDSLRAVIFSGDILPAKHLRRLKSLVPRARLFNVYGQTEANSSMCYPVAGIPDEETWRIPIGKPFPNFEVFALDENRKVIDRPGETGELYIRSNSVAMGYWDDPERTEESFPADPRSRLSNRKVYRTGDLVTLDTEGNYLFLGRKDHQVKIRGYRVQLNEIESVLSNHPSIKEAVVVAIPDELIGNRIVSHVATSGGKRMTEMEVFEYCHRTLPAYMVPEKFIFHDEFPKTPTGKTDKKYLSDSTKCLTL